MSPDVPADTGIDLVFINFIEDQTLQILGSLMNKTFTDADVQLYSPFLANELLGLFAEKEWQTV